MGVPPNHPSFLGTQFFEETPKSCPASAQESQPPALGVLPAAQRTDWANHGAKSYGDVSSKTTQDDAVHIFCWILEKFQWKTFVSLHEMAMASVKFCQKCVLACSATGTSTSAEKNTWGNPKTVGKLLKNGCKPSKNDPSDGEIGPVIVRSPKLRHATNCSTWRCCTRFCSTICGTSEPNNMPCPGDGGESDREIHDSVS